ncbi:MAG TPA: F0F1 ATP synthase subunit A [Clostridiales bacterium]|nr:F0F1 ATP synthase subunit A [Clostridiales bacterium]
MTILPVVFGIVLKVLFIPHSEGIEISGAYVYFEWPMPLMPLIISEAQINSWLVLISLLFLCLYLTNGIKEGIHTKRQVIAEWMVEAVEGLVKDNMGDYFSGFAPFIAAVMGLSAFSSLLSLFGLFPPTSDLNIVAGWALLVFFLITYYKMKCGPVHYLKSFAEPVPFLAPLNIISEFATPISMAFRHYGNILSGTVISVLIAAALQGLTHLLLGKLPGFIGEFPFLRIGIPAFLSVYFDLFSGLLQAFIFAMLTMLYIGGAFSLEDYLARKNKNVSKT